MFLVFFFLPLDLSSGCFSTDAMSVNVSPFAPSLRMARIDEKPIGENTKFLLESAVPCWVENYSVDYFKMKFGCKAFITTRPSRK